MLNKLVRYWFTIIVIATSAGSVAADLKEGQDYVVIESAPVQVDSNNASKITVTEFFSYQCPHCFAFSKPLHEWVSKLPNDVKFEREAVAIGHEPWIAIARSYYALRSIGKLDTLDAKIFNAIHEQGVRLNEVPYIMGWLSKQGVAPTEFDTAYRSQEARDAFAHGEQLSIAYKIPSIPVMVIDGKYLVVIVSNVDFVQQLTTVDKLIARARLSKATKK